MVISKNIQIVRVNTSKNDSKSLEVLKDSIKKQTQMFENKLKDSSSELDNIKKDIVNSENILIGLKDSIQAKENEFADITNKIDNLKIIEEKYGKLDVIEFEKNSISNKELKEEILKQNVIFAEKQKELEILKNNIIVLEHDIVVKTESIKIFQQQEKNILYSIETLSNNLKSLENEIAEKNKSIDTLKNTEAELEKIRLEFLEKQNAKRLLDTEILLFASKVETLKLKEKDLENLEKDIEIKTKISNEFIHTKKDLELLQESKNKLVEENKEIETFIFRKKQDLKNAEDEILVKTNKNKEIEKVIEDNQKEKSSLENSIYSFTVELEHKKQEYDVFCKKIENENNLLKAKRSEISRLIMLNKKHLKTQEVATFLKEIENGKQ